MNIRRFRALHAAGATFAEIGRECGCDWRTVRKYLAEDAASVPPAGPPRMGTQPLLITPFIPLVEAWLRADLRIKGTVVHERLVAEYGFTGHYPSGESDRGEQPGCVRRGSGVSECRHRRVLRTSVAWSLLILKGPTSLLLDQHAGSELSNKSMLRSDPKSHEVAGVEAAAEACWLSVRCSTPWRSSPRIL